MPWVCGIRRSVRGFRTSVEKCLIWQNLPALDYPQSRDFDDYYAMRSTAELSCECAVNGASFGRILHVLPSLDTSQSNASYNKVFSI